MIRFSLFKNSRAKEPLEILTFDDYVENLRDGKWKRAVEKLRDTTKGSRLYRQQKNNLHAVTVSGLFKTRDNTVPMSKRFKGHTGLIAIDVDKKDNPLLKANDIIDKDSILEFVSCSGEGRKIVYQCQETDDAKVHRRIFDAVVERLAKKNIKINVDPIVKSIASLQYVSYDPDLYYNPSSKLVIKALAPIKRDAIKPKSTDVESDLAQLNDYVDALGGRDITSSYEDWMIVMFGISYSLGEAGRAVMHKICSAYKEYSEEECNEKFDACLERADTDKPVTVASVFQLINKAAPKVKLKHLARKYSVSHKVKPKKDLVEADDVADPDSTDEQSDLSGLVRYKLFLFKKIYDKETNDIVELKPVKLNLNEFEKLLRKLGFFRYEFNRVKYVRIVDNIVENVDVADILRLLTDYIEQDGDYNFTYRKVEYFFSWEEIAHLWREVRAVGTTWNQIATSLTHWVPNLLKDTADTSYIPYLNGVVKITKDKIELMPYSKLKCENCKMRGQCVISCTKQNKQIWKERILARNFTYIEKAGMFEEFFVNVCGRGNTLKERAASQLFRRAAWYYGYMLQGFKRKSMARAWLLYDIKAGNSGRSGKTIIGQAVGKIRSMVTIDGKQFDIKNRFAFQIITPWTDVVFIDDPSKYMSIVPLFNMISGELYADKKGIEPVVIEAKFMFASNWILEQEGNSEIGRQFVTQVDDFYVRYGKENNDSITPIVDYHGKEFFTDWDEKDWAQFDSFSMRCLQIHLKGDAPENTIIGNAGQIRFIQVNEEEMFFELCSAFVENLRVDKNGQFIISQGVLMSVIKESNEQLKNVKAGRIARDFLGAIGVRKVEITSVVQGALTKMAYRLLNTDGTGVALQQLDLPAQFIKKLQANFSGSVKNLAPTYRQTTPKTPTKQAKSTSKKQRVKGGKRG